MTKDMKALDTLLMRMLLSADNPWEVLDEIQAKVDGYKKWMTNLAEHQAALGAGGQNG